MFTAPQKIVPYDLCGPSAKHDQVTRKKRYSQCADVSPFLPNEVLFGYPCGRMTMRILPRCCTQREGYIKGCRYATSSQLAAMFPKASLALIVPLALLAVGSPTLADLESRASIDTSSHCGQWDTVTAGPYSLLLDQWGASGATSGSQCANLVSMSGTTISWVTKWTWTGGNGVKSFTNVQLNQGINKQLSAISSMPVGFICIWGPGCHSIVFVLLSSLPGRGRKARPVQSSPMSRTTSSPRTPPAVRT